MGSQMKLMAGVLAGGAAVVGTILDAADSRKSFQEKNLLLSYNVLYTRYSPTRIRLFFSRHWTSERRSFSGKADSATWSKSISGLLLRSLRKAFITNGILTSLVHKNKHPGIQHDISYRTYSARRTSALSPTQHFPQEQG
jgi:hypothetical protein